MASSVLLSTLQPRQLRQASARGVGFAAATAAGPFSSRKLSAGVPVAAATSRSPELADPLAGDTSVIEGEVGGKDKKKAKKKATPRKKVRRLWYNTCMCLLHA